MWKINWLRERSRFIIGCRKAQYLAFSSLIFSLLTFSSFWLLAIGKNSLADYNALYAYSRYFHKLEQYLKKGFEILEKWFYDNYMVLNPRKYDFMSIRKTNGNEVYTYHEIRLKKTAAEKLLGITIDEHLKFKEHVKNI